MVNAPVELQKDMAERKARGENVFTPHRAPIDLLRGLGEWLSLISSAMPADRH